MRFLGSAVLVCVLCVSQECRAKDEWVVIPPQPFDVPEFIIRRGNDLSRPIPFPSQYRIDPRIADQRKSSPTVPARKPRSLDSVRYVTDPEYRRQYQRAAKDAVAEQQQAKKAAEEKQRQEEAVRRREATRRAAEERSRKEIAAQQRELVNGLMGKRDAAADNGGVDTWAHPKSDLYRRFGLERPTSLVDTAKRAVDAKIKSIEGTAVPPARPSTQDAEETKSTLPQQLADILDKADKVPKKKKKAVPDSSDPGGVQDDRPLRNPLNR